jgi:hemerythrin-like domain-containing protein
MKEEAHANIQDALRDDHRRLDALIEALLNPVHVNDAVLADRAFRDLELGLVAHIDVEDQHMLPLLEKEDPAEAATIRAEHERIRKLLAELGIGLEIHVVREETMEELARFLRNHAAREEGLLYRLAEDALEEAPRRSILERLKSVRSHRGHRHAA